MQPTVSVTDITSGTANINVVGGDGAARLVVIRPTAVAAAAPSDGATYTASATYAAGSATGPENYVLAADGTTGSLTVTGLSPLTDYTVDVYAYNGSAGAQNYLTTLPGTAPFTTLAPVATTYTWNGTGSSWSAAGSWTPARTTPANNDILVFDGNVTPSATAALDFTSSQTIAQLQLTNRVSVTLTNAGAPRTLLLDGNVAGDDLAIGTSSALRLEPSTAGAPIVIDVTAGETARIAGAFTSDAATGVTGTNRLIGREAIAIVVPAGGLFVAGANTTGGPFDGSVPNAVVFERGANYRQEGGSSPFDLPQPATLVEFQSGSIYDFARTDGSPALSGRTYGLLRFSTISSGLANMEGSSPLTILNNLEVAAPTTVGINLTNGIFIGGNILVDAGGSLTFDPGSASAVVFDGTVPQTVSGPGPVVFGSAATLTINNASGITLLAPVRANGGLDLQSGLLTTTSINLLTLAATSVVEGGSATSFVNGPVARVLPANTTASQLFPVGKQSAYRPVTLTPATLTQATTVTVEQMEGAPAPQPFNDGITRVSGVRRYAISASPGITTPGIFTGTVTLSFGPDDKVTDPAQPSLVIAQSDGTVWNSVGRSASTGVAGTPPEVFVAGTLTSAPFQTFDAFSVFALASTDPDASNNPLPVQLLSFGAERRPAGVQVRWATATEQNSARFEVQRSATGQAFRTIASVAAQGNSNSRHEYTVFDQQPLTGTGYYRLHQLDHDGKSSYSAVISVTAPGEMRVYPNPVLTKLTVELPAAGGRYRILSMLGGTLMAGELFDSKAELDMTTLPTGLYQLEISTPAGREMRKIIKQ
ncbi:T9SS type A sorting domain-containing protein [Hymenobacter sp. ISL-91]|uniref:T9SS type A sorting domain-containing protein n=1 Tax=Hymenobacter sp. ISL-91 TaxID=2819151 RepID=UPI001BEAD0AD|nr:T9SS type A sorting domain-containing protein [Hymenobacter sp. ISL-91]MBT2556816.1 T9SS type A sorting domain-containing protein [Hymenobacter sp. ISL-91]